MGHHDSLSGLGLMAILSHAPCLKPEVIADTTKPIFSNKTTPD
jgi:hypothetical protein